MKEIRDLSPKEKFNAIIEDNAKRAGKKIYGEFTVLENTSTHIKIKTTHGVIMVIPHKDVKEWSAPTGKVKKEIEEKSEGGKKDSRGEGEGEGDSKDKKSSNKKLKEKLNLQFDKINQSIASSEEDILKIIEAGIKNIWLVGPAGCGKTVMSKNIAYIMDKEYLLISCGLGTSATEFMGYKYPERESTLFQEYYAKDSIIILDEFTALDPSVAQVANSALANGILTTTTGLVRRHENCIIIATSNTFGSGANRQYVSNNQLDASTIDRFVGGIIEVDYSKEYEKRFDKDVTSYVHMLREVISQNSIRKVASTRMIIEGEKLKRVYPDNWAHRLISNWSANEIKLIEQFLQEPALPGKDSSWISINATRF